MDRNDLETRDCFVNENTNIVQSNYLIERKQKLSLPATQLLFTLTGMINKDDEDLKEYRVDVRSFSKLWGVDSKLAYRTVAEALEELNTKGISEHSINPNTKKPVFTTVRFISFGKYELGEGYARIRIEPELKPHYIALQREFTRFSLNNILQLQENGAQVNTMRTYELLKQFAKIGSRTLTVKEYKEKLGLIIYDKKGNIVKEKYKGSNANLKEYVIEPAKALINTSTDIEVDYEINGRGINAQIKFSIKKRHSASQTDSTAVKDSDKTSAKIKVTLEDGKEMWIDKALIYPNTCKANPEESADELRSEEESDVIDERLELYRPVLARDEEFTDDQVLELREAAIRSEYANSQNYVSAGIRDIDLSQYLHVQDVYTNARIKDKSKRYPYLLNAVKENWAKYGIK